VATKSPKCQTENPETSRFCADCGTLVISYDLDRLTATLADRYRVERELGRGGTDGTYGPADAAGALGNLLITGPTFTNIMDLCLILVG
jgi:hypothetical protein